MSDTAHQEPREPRKETGPPPAKPVSPVVSPLVPFAPNADRRKALLVAWGVALTLVALVLALGPGNLLRTFSPHSERVAANATLAPAPQPAAPAQPPVPLVSEAYRHEVSAITAYEELLLPDPTLGGSVNATAPGLSAPLALTRTAKWLDHALLLAAKDVGLTPADIEIREVEQLSLGGEPYHRQTIALSLTGLPRVFVTALSGRLEAETGSVPALLPVSLELAPAADAVPGGWRILVQTGSQADGGGDWVETHRLLLAREEETPGSMNTVDMSGQGPAGPDYATKASETSTERLGHGGALPLAPAGARPYLMAVVIDDLGESVDYAAALADLPFPVTFAVWPRSSHATEVAELAHAAGREVFIHQPMEPEGYPKIKPGPGALLTSMDARKMRTILAENIDRVPHAIGMNNHMGSRFTANPSAMTVAIQEAKRRGLFFLDSLTTPHSTVVEVGRAQNTPVLQRDIFLDVVRNEDAVLHQLRKTARVARLKGFAVCIGHPFPETLAALKRFAMQPEPDVAVTRLASVLERSERKLAESSP